MTELTNGSRPEPNGDIERRLIDDIERRLEAVEQHVKDAELIFGELAQGFTKLKAGTSALLHSLDHRLTGVEAKTQHLQEIPVNLNCPSCGRKNHRAVGMDEMVRCKYCSTTY